MELTYRVQVNLRKIDGKKLESFNEYLNESSKPMQVRPNWANELAHAMDNESLSITFNLDSLSDCICIGRTLRHFGFTDVKIIREVCL